MITNFSWDGLNTFKDLYETILSLDEKEFRQLMELETNGKDILESVLRLFAYLEVIQECNNYTACSGNFNLATININSSRKDLFYEFKNNVTSLKKLKDNGDSSDLTLFNKSKNTMLAFTSKNLKEKNMRFDNMDFTKLFYYGEQYNNYIVQYAVCCKDRNVFYSMIDNCKKTTLTDTQKSKLKDILVIDKEHLINGFLQFKQKYTDVQFHDAVREEKYRKAQIESTEIQLRPHQEYTVNKTFHTIREYGKQKQFCNILWGHVARSGKSYMAFGLIRKVFQTCLEKSIKMNVCLITTAPNETIKQYLEIIEQFNITKLANVVTSLNYKKDESNKLGSLFIFSKQLLTHKDNKEKAQEVFKHNKVSILLTDETHNGGSTNVSKDLFNRSFKKCHKVFITATYNKVAYNFDINETIKWGLEDIQIMKTGMLDMIYKDAQTFVSETNMKSDSYNLYPNLSIIGVDNLFENQEERLTNMFAMKSNKFKDEDAIFETVRYLLTNVFRHVDLVNKKINQTRITMSTEEFTPVIIMFLPANNISAISKLVELMINKINQSFEVCKCNTIDSNDSFKKNIDESIIKAKNKKKEAVIVLTGTQGHLGISLSNCDLVILMNNSNSVDFMFQSMFRCMTERTDGTKKFGYVVDLNLKRSIFSVLEYARQNNSQRSDIKALEDIVKRGVVDFTITSKIDVTGAERLVDRNKMFQDIQNYYNSIKISRIDYYINNMDRLDEAVIANLSKDMLNKIKSLKTHIKENKGRKELIFQDEEENEGSKELDKKSPGGSSSSITSNSISANEITYFISSIKYLIPMACIITLDGEGGKKLNLVDMLVYITEVELLNSILLEQFSTWCGRKVSTMDIQQLIETTQQLSLEDTTFKQQVEDVSSTIKLIFLESKENEDELSKLVEKHLTPSTLEKKKNAEVSTPDKLCKEMLEPLAKEIKEMFKESQGKINSAFKVLEPCCGKGIFLLNIYKFLKDNSTLSKKQILEECIYFADISPLNIFICRLLLDPKGEYALNYYTGNTLELDIKKEWNLEGFDSVIGNPPYNNELWSKFVDKSINYWIKDNGYLLYVHPANWRKPEHKVGSVMLKYDIIILYIYNIKHTQKLFNCNVRVDWYLIKKNKSTIDTIVIDEENISYKLNLKNKPFVPNKIIEKIYKFINYPKKLNVVRSHKFISNNSKFKETQDEEYKYKILTNLNSKGARVKYFNTYHEDHFKKKICMSYALYLYPFLDKGTMTPTEHILYQVVENEEYGVRLINYLNSEEFKEILDSCKWIGYQTDHKIFKYLPDLS